MGNPNVTDKLHVWTDELNIGEFSFNSCPKKINNHEKLIAVLLIRNEEEEDITKIDVYEWDMLKYHIYHPWNIEDSLFNLDGTNSNRDVPRIRKYW